MYKEILTNRNTLVTKSNVLIEANYKLGATEQKIILSLASNIQPSDSDFKTYTLSVKDFHKFLGLKGSPKYSELRAITKQLMQKVFEVKIENKVIQVSWLSYVAYNEDEGRIEIRFDPFLKPYLLQLKREFTSYKLENIVKLKSSYAIRIYELLKQYEKIKERTFQVKELRELLGTNDIYPAYANFKQRVLNPALKELDKKTDISFSFEEIKHGKKVDRLNYPFCTIDPNIGVVAVPDERINLLSRLIEPEKTIYSVIKFVDIAGIVEGASKGEGLGNKFLANIRETDLIVYILRSFQNKEIVSVRSAINPTEEADLLETELILKDFFRKRSEVPKKRINKRARNLK